MAVSRATSPLRTKARINAGPATPAAIPIKTKIPAPIIAPTPIMRGVHEAHLPAQPYFGFKFLHGSEP